LRVFSKICIHGLKILDDTLAKPTYFIMMTPLAFDAPVQVPFSTDSCEETFVYTLHVI